MLMLSSTAPSDAASGAANAAPMGIGMVAHIFYQAITNLMGAFGLTPIRLVIAVGVIVAIVVGTNLRAAITGRGGWTLDDPVVEEGGDS